MSDTWQAYTLMPEPNSTYLSHTKNIPVTAEPMSGATMGLLMIMSTLQYQAPYMSPVYQNAASQAGKAAFTQSGGQAMQNQIQSKAESAAKGVVYSAGINDTELGVVLGGAKVVRDRQIDVNGPRIFFIKTHVTAAPDHGSLGIKVDF
jgi:hypothetical protein